MASRRELEERKAALRRDIREDYSSGKLAPGTIVASGRELAKRYQLSINIARQTLQQLVDEGILYTIPGVGTFAGRRLTPVSGFYLFLLPYDANLISPFPTLQSGFEERIAQLGGASLAMPLSILLEQPDSSQFPDLAGVFDFSYDPRVRRHWRPGLSIPLVTFRGRPRDVAGADVISFDDVDGGRQATQYLLNLGHTRIAYLAMHRLKSNPGIFFWSFERERGWRQALEAVGLSTEGLAYHPTQKLETSLDGLARIACQTATELVRRADITAVVAANDMTALGLIEALRSVEVSPEHWPAIIGFDNLPRIQGQILTSLRLPWEKVGHLAAELLWERHHGRLVGPPQHRQVPMHLIPRLTSQRGWFVKADMVTREMGRVTP